MNRILLIIAFFFFSFTCWSQLEKIVVETYYVSDDNDATDVYGGGVEEGSVTYRIYVDMVPGSRLVRIFGDEGYPFEISSTEIFFNHLEDGQTFAKEFLKARYQESTVALDTWLTIGQTTKLQGGKVYYGVLKDQDDDGTFIGGENNDGGSEMIAGGLLANDTPAMGIPLTVADGMDTLNFSPTNWFSFGLVDFVTGQDTTMFGSVNQRNFFRSENFELSCSGVYGVVPDSNQVLIAQLTTKGELSFKLNLEIEYEVDGETISVTYVSTNENTSSDIVFNPFLNFPFVCGCNDPQFIEYNPEVICFEEGSCQNLIVFGCMDPTACNYDESVNFNVPELCCYPGYCAGRNIEEVCPQYLGSDFDFSIYPNPAESNLKVQLLNGEEGTFDLSVVNAYGVKVFTKQIVLSRSQLTIENIDVSSFTPGIYHVVFTTNLGVQSKLFVKV